MGIYSEALKHMLAAGMTNEQVIGAIEAMENTKKPNNSNALRQAKFRENKKALRNASNASNVTSNAAYIEHAPAQVLVLKEDKKVSKREREMSLGQWETINGELKAEDFIEWGKKNSFKNISAMLDKFKNSCQAKNRKYLDFKAAFRSWDWKDFQTPPEIKEKPYRGG